MDIFNFKAIIIVKNVVYNVKIVLKILITVYNVLMIKLGIVAIIVIV